MDQNRHLCYFNVNKIFTAYDGSLALHNAHASMMFALLQQIKDILDCLGSSGFDYI